METLHSKRLLLRKFKINDLSDFHRYAANPNIGPHAGWEPHSSIFESFEILLAYMSKDYNWVITEKGIDRFIGSISIRVDDKRLNPLAFSMGYCLDEPYWGQGYMTEAAKTVIVYAFEALKIELLSIYHYPYNKRSKSIINKCAFYYEGQLRMAKKRYDGELLDECCYSMTQDEYEHSKAQGLFSIE